VQTGFADPKTDFVFKRIFGSEAGKPLLVALLNHLLELDSKNAILDLEHLPTEQRTGPAGLKLSIVDVKCVDVTGRRFVVEMQVLKVEGFEKRAVYNACKAYVVQLKEGDSYPSLCDVIGVTICNFNVWESPIPMLSRWRMQEQHSGALGLPQLQHVFLELPKYTAGSTPESLVDKWAFFFREARNLQEVPAALAQAPFHDALQVARAQSFSVDEWTLYERAKMAEQDARGALALATREGEARGQAKGKAEAVLVLLAARSIPIDEQARARILTCTDVALLDQWIIRATSIRSVSELWQ
jgi:predicted transposase/invertase (TIGR01784 family)